jgi:aryl-alcohol dehydrogenase-like predicted oxidoreductase
MLCDQFGRRRNRVAQSWRKCRRLAELRRGYRRTPQKGGSDQQIRDWSRWALHPRFSPETISANTPITEFVKKFAEKRNATAAQLSLAWLLARKPFIVPIHGTRNIDHLNEDLGTVNVQLPPEDLR